MLFLFFFIFFFILFFSFLCFFFFFFNDTATTEIYTLSLHDALPIFDPRRSGRAGHGAGEPAAFGTTTDRKSTTSELQSHSDLVCRLLLEKKKKKHNTSTHEKKKKKHIKTHQSNQPL